MINRLCSAIALAVLVSSNVPCQSAETKALGAKAPSATAKTAESMKFLRVVHDAKDRPLALETAVARYVSSAKDKPFTVDLIGCIHVADKKYYDQLNERFKQYDAVLFELVMPEGQSLAGLGNRKSNHPIAALQQSLPEVLDLAYQLKEINYTAKNFVHADLSPDEMSKAIRSRGDSGASVFFKVVFDVFRESNRQAAIRAKKKGGEFADLQLFAAMFDNNRPLALKRLMAEQMEMVGSETGLGPTLDTILVKDRNNAAMKVLAQKVKQGVAKIGIFYGAAHMPDFDRRLTQELNFKRQSLTWDCAWDMSGK